MTLNVIIWHIQDIQGIRLSQHISRKGSSCMTNLISSYDQVTCLGGDRKSMDVVFLQQSLQSLLSPEAFCWRSCQSTPWTSALLTGLKTSWAQRVVMILAYPWNRPHSLKGRTLNKGPPGLLQPVQSGAFLLSHQLLLFSLSPGWCTEPHALCSARGRCQFTASWPQAPENSSSISSCTKRQKSERQFRVGGL